MKENRLKGPKIRICYRRNSVKSGSVGAGFNYMYRLLNISPSVQFQMIIRLFCEKCAVIKSQWKSKTIATKLKPLFFHPRDAQFKITRIGISLNQVPSIKIANDAPPHWLQVVYTFFTTFDFADCDLHFQASENVALCDDDIFCRLFIWYLFVLRRRLLVVKCGRSHAKSAQTTNQVRIRVR